MAGIFRPFVPLPTLPRPIAAVFEPPTAPVLADVSVTLGTATLIATNAVPAVGALSTTLDNVSLTGTAGPVEALVEGGDGRRFDGITGSCSASA